MKKVAYVLEIFISIAFVFISTFFVYKYLLSFPSFWDAQFAWSSALMACWIIVSIGYFHQGWLVRTNNHSHARDVSIVLPIAVFIVQCILFVKGVFFQDWSLIFGAVVVNSGVVFSLYNIIRVRKSIFKK